MSDRFETRLANWFRDRLEENAPQAGQKLLAEFHDTGTADAFADSLVEMADEAEYPIAGDEDETLPAILPEDGVPTYLARVTATVDDDAPFYEITQGYATRMRNLISSSAQTDDPRALLMVLESDTTLDTLEASEQLFGEDGLLNLEDFRRTLLDPETCDSKPGKALLEALDSILEDDSVYSSDVAVLDTLCRIRDAVDEEQADALPLLIAELPEFIREDYIGDNWFEQQQPQAAIRESAEKFLKDNKRHAAQLRRAHRTGTDTKSKLESNYEEDYVRTVLDSASWKEISHTESEKNERQRTSRQFRKLEVEAEDHRIYSPTNASETRRAVIGLAKDGSVKLTAEFSADLEETPYELINSDGDEIGSTAKRENRVSARIDDLSTDEPTFATLNFYVGKKTTQGKPTHQFNLGVVPRWFYEATDNVTLDVDVSEERFVRHGDEDIRLTPPQRLDFDYDQSTETIELTGGLDNSIELTEPIFINPSPPETVEQVGCLLAPPDEIPIRIVFLTEVSTAETEEIVFPLMLASINNPERWSAGELQLPDSLTIDTDRGEIYTATEDGIRIEEEALELIQIEQEIAREGLPNQRIVDSDEHRAGTIRDSSELEQFDELREAYAELFEHFNERNRTPSTDPWDQATKQHVIAVLDAYQQAVESIGEQPSFEQYEPLRGLGMVHSTTADKTWLTPYHPVKLSYALRIAQWRDDTLRPDGATGGFRSEQFIEKFNSSGLLPYIVSATGDGELLRGIQYGQNPLWGVYSPIESPGSVTPSYMERVVRDKLDTFVQSFPMLFKLHSGRNLVINLINMGDLRPVVKGLYELYKRIKKGPFEPPQILLRIYGGPSEGDALDRFFGENRKSRLRTQLEQKNDEIVDLLRSNVMYVLEDEYTSDSHKEAHLTFFRGLLTEEPGLTGLDDLPSGLHLDGLLPQESIDVREEQSGTVYSVGFGYDDQKSEVEEIARIANTLEAGKKNKKYLPKHILKKTIKSTHKADLRKVWDDSLWVVHVQPNVDLEFYTESRSEIGSGDGMVMIHYSDQYDSSSPNYDVITSTTKRQPYVTALRRALEEVQVADYLNPERVLSTLIAVDGELALELQRADDKTVIEKVGFAGGLALSRHLLKRASEDYTWVPLSLNELARHDRSTRASGPGLLQYDDYGAASDDLCMVGIPSNPAEMDVKLWLVETKGGSSSIKKGREQVNGALAELESIFHPSTNYSDQALLRSGFGKTIIDIAQRMQSYDVLTAQEMEAINSVKDALREGAFEVSFLTDTNGHVGEVIRVQSNTQQSKLNLEHEVRSLDIPLNVMSLLEDDDVHNALPDLNLSHLAFDIQPRTGTKTAPGIADDPERSSEQPSTTVSASETASTHSQTTEVSSAEKTDRARSEVDETSDSDGQSASETKDEEVGVELKTEDNSVDSEGSDSVTVEESASTETGESKSSETNSQSSEDQTTESEAEGSTSTRPAIDGEEDEASSVETEEAPLSPNTQRVLSQLETSPEPDTSVDRGKLVSDLKREFESLGVDIHPPNPSSISVGPRKIGVNVLPKEGQTVEEILRQLNSLSVHIQAGGQIIGQPVPSKGAVRLEIPHNDPTDVMLREGIEALQDELDSPVTIPLGVDTENEHYALPMLREKHALVGGATGSGKSNFLSTVVASLAIQNRPDEVKMSILDPKGVDFGRFEPLPHVQRGTYLDLPEACTAYLLDLLKEDLPARKQRLQESGFTSVSELNEYTDEMGHEPMPYHVIIIDEFADLIMSLSDDQDEFEEAVTRLAQVGRAHGYVIFLATQRPSADIVSGKIKANFPCRISFRLPSNTDSRVILDQPGAEDLQGAGDMIAITQDGQLNLQGYRLTPKDAITIRDSFSDLE